MRLSVFASGQDLNRCDSIGGGQSAQNCTGENGYGIHSDRQRTSCTGRNLITEVENESRMTISKRLGTDSQPKDKLRHRTALGWLVPGTDYL